MDISTILTSIGVSTTGAIAAAWWFSKTLVSHRLAKYLENYKSEWKRELDKERTELEGTVKERVETVLGDRAANREYQLEARKRLYLLIGPLKFQLLLACRDVAHRIEGHGLKVGYSMTTTGFYGLNTIYRVLRPLAIAELIEQQVAYADFAVDESAISLLRFKKSASLAITGDEVVCDHPNLDWNNQKEHVFSATLTEAAHALIDKNPHGIDRVIEFHEFAELFNSNHGNQGLLSLERIFFQFTVQSKPIFWLRLVAFAHICREHIGSAGNDLGFEYAKLDVEELLKKCEDQYLMENLQAYVSAVEESIFETL